MSRIVLTLVLAALIAMPHGICFCEIFTFDASTHHVDDSASQAIVGVSTALDSPHDHDPNCSCRLTQAMLTANPSVAIDPQTHLDLLSSCPATDLSGTIQNVALVLRVHSDEISSPLIPCALRI